MQGYKLFRVRRDGTLGSLFINRRPALPLGVWLPAASYPTKGFAVRPGWHVTKRPHAPHLSLQGRRWYCVEFRGYEVLQRPARQGGTWYLARQLKILGPVRPATKRRRYVANTS